MLANIIKNAKALDQCKPVVASWQVGRTSFSYLSLIIDFLPSINCFNVMS